MNNSLTTFDFNNNQVRTTLKDGEVWFCLKDICQSLSISNSKDAKNRLNEKGVGTADLLTEGGKQSATFINESNLYKLIFQSRKPEARAFEEWVTGEVLPTIRRTGCYRAEREALTDEFKQVIKEICGESLRNAWLDILNSRDKERQQAVLNQIALMFDMTVQAQVRVECEKRISKMREVISLPVA